MLGQIRDYFTDMVFKTVIHNNVRLCEAPIYKKPIHLYDSKSQGAQDYWALAEEIIALTQGTLERKAGIEQMPLQAEGINVSGERVV